MALSASDVGATNGLQLLLRRSGCWTCLRGEATARWKGGEEQMARVRELILIVFTLFLLLTLIFVKCAW